MNETFYHNRNMNGLGRKQIAVYGKGGIGKSTISANVSAALAKAGNRVIQIGCDPKQDSTRLLLEGQRVKTVLDYLRSTAPEDRKLETVVHTGFAGVACVEAGGPEPGVGCAGRGIISALDLLKDLDITAHRFDVVLYDVLGDVVCGGFAVPLREHYADFIYIVTSGEFMSLYAANNILRGVRNFEERGLRMAGLILNCRDLASEADRVRRFSDAVRLPLVASFPKSMEISAAEQLKQTTLQAFPQGSMANQFMRLAQDILGFSTPLPACPLSPDALESTVIDGKIHIVPLQTMSAAPKNAKPLFGEIPRVPFVQQRRYRSKSVNRHEVFHGCAFNGAVHTLIQIKDTVTLAHGPRSCAYISSHGITSAARRAAIKYGGSLENLSEPNLQSTEMDERVAIFGGNDSLEKSLCAVAHYEPKAVFVATTCTSGIIGDDVHVAINAARDVLGQNVPVIPVAADGDINGDYMQGIIDAMMRVADHYVDKSVMPEENSVNIVAEKNLATNTESNYLAIRSILDSIGLRVNCRFIRNCTTEELRSFLRGRVNLLASADLCGRTIMAYLADHFGARFLTSAFPVGFNATELWLKELAKVFGKEAEALSLVRQERIKYDRAVKSLRPALEGKRVFIVTQSYQIDWVLDLAFDLGMEIVKVGVLASAWDEGFVTHYKGKFPLAVSYTREQRDREIDVLAPDLTLTNAIWQDQPDDRRVDVIPIIPDVGFDGAIGLAQRWRRLLRLPPKEGWRYDI